ncbi:divalent metal cation transporter [Pirellulales bacterium]|nr:divalent metal cation transporter [Pirellulales bacterium]
MSDVPNVVEQERQMLRDAQSRGMFPTLGAYFKLSGPGWLQSAITLGGGSLASSLYLGILGGYSLMWLQPLAMIFGIIMLSAIGYVTLSTGQRPFDAIRKHVNPVLAWGWAVAVAAANIVWCMPQFSLADGVIKENLLPSVFGTEGYVTLAAGENTSTAIICLTLLLVCTAITFSYDRGGRGIKIYERILKLLVGLIVLCFAAVVVTVARSDAGLDFAAIGQGFIPNWRQWFQPAESLTPLLDAVGEAGSTARDYWTGLIVDKQQDVIISAAATAVGINMTFLFPYSMLRKGWTKEFRGLAIFDLSTGMLIPFVLVTGCVVVAAAAQFHTRVTEDFVIKNGDLVPPADLRGPYETQLMNRMQGGWDDSERKAFDAETADLSPIDRQAALEKRLETFQAELPLDEKKLAAALINRKARHLSKALEPLTGQVVADLIFGIGVLAMALSTISLLMLISGFVFCEMLGIPPEGEAHRLGALPAGIIGSYGPFAWGGAAFYLAVPTSIFGFILLPFAYVTFVLMMNQRSLLGEHMPRGFRRLLWNSLMGIAATIAAAGSLYMIHKSAGTNGFIAVGIFIALAVVAHFRGRGKTTEKS